MFLFLFLPFASTITFAQPAGKLPPLAPPCGEMPPTFWEQHGTTILIGSFVLLVLGAVIVWKLLQPKPPVVLPPEVVAREALQKLAGQPEDGRLLSETSQILRRYVAAVFELSPLELTTTEFCRALNTSEKIGSELAASIASFLRACDERKFSPSTPSTAFNAVKRALELFFLVEARRAELREPAARSR